MTARLLGAAALLAIGGAAAAKVSPALQGWGFRRMLALRYRRLGLEEEPLRIQGPAGGQSLAYFDTRRPRAAGRAGAPILLLHGFTADKECWLGMVRRLGERHRVVAIDLAGHGASPPAADDDHRLGPQAERAHAAAAALGLGRYHVLAHSMGGAVAMKLALAHPEEVLTLGLISTAGVDWQHPEQFNDLLDAKINPLIVSKRWRALDKVRYVTSGPLGLRFVTWLADAFLTARDLELEDRYKAIFRQIGEFFSDEELRRIRQPTLIVWGSRDRVLRPDCADHYAERIPGARPVERFQRVGHTPPIEAPEPTARRYLEFLARATPPAA